MQGKRRFSLAGGDWLTLFRYSSGSVAETQTLAMLRDFGTRYPAAAVTGAKGSNAGQQNPLASPSVTLVGETAEGEAVTASYTRTEDGSWKPTQTK